MVTTTATTSTSTVSGSSILTSLGAGSGVDTAALVTSLVTANFAAKNASLAAQDTALTAQISSVAKVQSGITSFASALSSLVKGGTLASQPTVSDTSVLTATALAGAKLSGLSASIAVTHLATAQIATTTQVFASRSAPVGTGDIVITFGTADVSFDPADADAGGTMANFQANPPPAGSAAGVTGAITVSIGDSDNTLDGIAAKINAAGSGVSATVVTDADGTARLTLKGPTGTNQAFTLEGDGDLSTLNVGGTDPATTIGSASSNAELSLDGIKVQRASNTISDLVPGVKLSLTGVTTTKPVTLGSSTPADAILQAVNDFVETYNQYLAVLTTETDPASGALRSDYNATGLLRSLRGLTLTTLSTGAAAGAPTNLASIGVGTNKDGTLSVDSTKLTAALTNTPEAVEALFADGTGATGGGLAAALNAISTAAVEQKLTINGKSESLGLVGSTALYTARLAKVTDAEDQVTTDTAAYQERLTKQYAASDAKVAAYKASQTALQNQIDQWNKSTS